MEKYSLDRYLATGLTKRWGTTIVLTTCHPSNHAGTGYYASVVKLLTRSLMGSGSIVCCW